MTGDCHVRFYESRGVRFPPATHQSHIHLVLDATDSPRFALTAVVTEFRKQYGTSARGRFAQVWIVGPVVDSVERLDV